MEVASGALPGGRSSSGPIADVIERMRAIDAALDPHDGVACFNRLYLKVTEAVGGRAAKQSFESPGFLERLDVSFAALYFEAYEAAVAGRECPEAWEPLFVHRANRKIPVIQFALAGMNAHINHDLPVAVVSTCHEFEITPEDGTPHARDYHLVNLILRDVEETVKKSFMTESLSRLDDACGSLDDALAMWSIYGARRLAWHQAELLWALRRHHTLADDYSRLLSRSVALAGHAFFV